MSSLKLDTVRVKLILSDVQVEWLKLAESLLLSLLSVALYMSVVFTELSFVPIMIIVIKRGWKEAIAFLSISTAILFYVMFNGIGRFPLDDELLLLSPTHYSFSFIESVTGFRGGRFLDFFFIFGCFGLISGYFVSRNYRLNYVIFFSIAAYAGIAVVPLLISWVIGGFRQFFTHYSNFIDAKTSSYVSQSIEQMSTYRSLLEPRGVDVALMERKFEIAADIYKNNVIFGIAPRGGYLIKQIFLIFMGILLVKVYLKRKLNRAALNFSIQNYRINDGWVWGLIISWSLVYLNLYLKNAVLGIMSWNISVVFSLLFFLRGLSLIKLLADRVKIPQILQYVVMIFFLFYSFIFFVTIVTGIGVADIWLKLRDNIENMKKRSDA